MPYDVHILDTSHWEGPPNYEEAPDDVDGVITKATEGINWMDDTLEAHVDGWLLKPHLFRGVFHYYRESYWVPDQVAHFVNTMEAESSRTGEPLTNLVDIWAWDIENRNNPWLADWRNGQYVKKADVVVDALDRLADRVQKLPWLYCNVQCYEDLLNSDSRLQPYPLWIAWPVPLARSPLLPKGRMNWSAWQYSWTLKYPQFLPGEPGDPVPYVDANWFNGSREDLINLTGSLRMIPKPPPPPKRRRKSGRSWWWNRRVRQ